MYSLSTIQRLNRQGTKEAAPVTNIRILLQTDNLTTAEESKLLETVTAILPGEATFKFPHTAVEIHATYEPGFDLATLRLQLSTLNRVFPCSPTVTPTTTTP